MANDIFTQETVDKLNASALTFNEVVTSRAGGVSTGSLIYQTLTPLGEATDTLKGRLDKIGTTYTDWGSTEGGTLTSAAQAFLNNTVGSAGFGNYYAWTGAFPHIVTPGLDPAATAGYAIRSNAQFFSAVTQTNDGASVSEPSLDDLRDIMRRDTAGYTLIGNTTIGCTVTAERQTVKVLETGNEYEWTGALPKTVSPGEDLTADAQWVSRTDVMLSNELADQDSTVLIAGQQAKEVSKYTAPFIGGIERILKSRLSDRVSIRDFGVVGDGTDETTKVQAAVTAVCGAGRALVVPPPITGSHYICQDVQFPNTSWKLVGDGGPTVVQFATPSGVLNQNIFDLTNCNGPAKYMEGIGFGRLTPGSYDGIIGLLTSNSNGLHMLRCWFRGLARGFDMNGTFFELDGCVFEYNATAINGLANAKESLIRGTTYYRNEQDIIIPAGDNSTFMHVDSTHIGTKTRGVDIRGDNAYVAGVTAKDDSTGYTPIIVRITSGKSNQVHGVTSSFGSDVIKVEGADSVGNQLFGLMVPAGSTVQRALNVSAAVRTCLSGADVKQASVAAFRLDSAPNSELHGAFSDGANIGLSINSLSGFRMFGGGFSASTTADAAQDSNNSTAPRFYGTRGTLTPITTAVFV